MKRISDAPFVALLAQERSVFTAKRRKDAGV